MQIMLVFEIQIFVHQIQPVDFWFNISYSAVFLREPSQIFFHLILYGATLGISLGFLRVP